jgi:prepilin peptidase CpaA
MSERLVQVLPLVALLLVAAVEDLRTRRIANWLSLSLLLAGLCGAAKIPLLASFTGAAAGFSLMFPLFAIGALGGGDVKLTAAVGAWIGPWNVLIVFALAAIVGMVIVIVQAIAEGTMATLLRNSALVAINVVHVKQVGAEHVMATGSAARAVRKPLAYAVPILVATLCVIAR